MQLKFLGTGGAFDIDYQNSAALLSFRDTGILIDCGFTVYPILVHKNLVHRVNYILLTHLHNDHCGSLANLILHKHVMDKAPKPTILYPSEQFKNEVYEFLKIQVKDPDKYVEFMPLEQFEGMQSVNTFGLHSEGMQSFAYIFEEDGRRIVYSGDLGKPDALFDKLSRMSSLPTCVYHDITFNPENTGHTYYKKLLPYLNGVEMFGYHCDPTENPDDNPIRLVFYEKDMLV